MPEAQALRPAKQLWYIDIAQAYFCWRGNIAMLRHESLYVPSEYGLVAAGGVYLLVKTAPMKNRCSHPHLFLRFVLNLK